MFFNRKKKYSNYSKKVLELTVVSFNVDLDPIPTPILFDGINYTWSNNYNEHEATLFLMSRIINAMLRTSDPNANKLKDKFVNIQNDWISKEYVNKERALLFIKLLNNEVQSQEHAASPSFEFSPQMPDITQNDPVSKFSISQYMLLLQEDLHTIGERISGKKLPLQFPFVMVVIDSITGQPEMFITLESGITNGTFLCVFDSKGAHSNLGDGEPYLDRHSFEKKSIEIVCKILNLDENTIVKKTEQ